MNFNLKFLIFFLQLVFEGDTLTLRCRAPRVAVGSPNDSEDLPAQAHIFWGWSESILEPNSTDDIIYHDPLKKFPAIQIDARHLSDSGLLDSILKIPYVTRNHTGTWDCRLRSEQANLSRNIAVMIISEKTKYCPAVETSNNKGQYSWPRTIRGRVVRLPCNGEEISSNYASYRCSNTGEWIELNTNDCSYQNEMTKVLEQFAKINLTIARGSIIESAVRLRNYTDIGVDDGIDSLTETERHRLSPFDDPMDIVYIAKTTTNYVEFLAIENGLAEITLDIVSQTMRLGHSLLFSAQLVDRSCTKLIEAAEAAAEFVQPSAQAQKSNLAMEIFRVRTDTFAGITCSWFKAEDTFDSRAKRIFQCNSAVNGIGLYDRRIDAAIQIPASIFQSLNKGGGSSSSSSSASLSMSPFAAPTQKLLVSVFKDSSLFPQNRTLAQYQVRSFVIGTKVSTRIENLTEPIYVMLRPTPYHNEISAPRPVWWNPESNDGAGGWSLEGCSSPQLIHGLLVFTCDRLGYFGLLQNVHFLNDFPENENAGARFRLSPPAFYVGGIVLFICTWINIVTYLAYGNSIQMARRSRHALVNTWLAISLLSFVFTVGIYQTEEYKVCELFGVAIHYFSLCVLLWMCVTANTMYKRMTRERTLPLPSEDGMKERVGSKPITGLYFAGWGIAMIICGISSAVNLREYASYSYCFFGPGPALASLFVPAVILLVFICILFVCIRCNLSTADDIGHMSEGTQATENVDLDLLEPSISANQNCIVNRYHSISLSMPTSSLQDDGEHTNGAQLKAQIITLFLYLMTWTMAAVSVASPLSAQLYYEEEIFSIVFAVSATLLGLFLLFFYCIARSDVRHQWSLLSCRNFGLKQCCCRSRTISDTKETNNVDAIVTYRRHANGTLNSNSTRSNSQCSKNRTSANALTMKYGELNGMHTLTRSVSPNGTCNNGTTATLPSVNLVHLHRQQYSSIDGSEVFYNPNQINVARKFFKKQKRLQKRNNFELQRARDLESTSDISSMISMPQQTRQHQPHQQQSLQLFSSSSKVNNTNIHVDPKNFADSAFRKDCIGASGSESGAVKVSNLNPNILSDSCNESDLIDADRIIVGAESLRALTTLNRVKVNNTAVQANASPMVANIYTNIPETQQPQHEIVTMRAEEKYGKKPKPIFDEEDETSLDDKVSLLAAEERDPETEFLFESVNESGSAQNVNSSFDDDLDESQSPNFVNESLNTTTPSSPLAAMNTIGLPIESSSELNQTISTIDEEHVLLLDRNEEYISTPLELESSDSFLRPLRKVQSVNNVAKSEEALFKALENQTRSISCTNVCFSAEAQTTTAGNDANEEYSSRSSPVLFSPSLCDINDMVQSPILSLPHPEMPSTSNRNMRRILTESTPQGSENNLFFENEKLFNGNTLRHFTSSPTSESDINYQNSELSIRSHQLYAPQPDNDLNLTLTDDNSQLYAIYQPSEVSDIDDDDLLRNRSEDRLLGSGGNQAGRRTAIAPAESDLEDVEEDILNDSQSSIDELYQQITRRNVKAKAAIQTASPTKSDVDEEESSECSIISLVEPNHGEIL